MLLRILHFSLQRNKTENDPTPNLKNQYGCVQQNAAMQLF